MLLSFEFAATAYDAKRQEGIPT